MGKNGAGISKTKLRSSYLTLIVSVSLVLFLLSVLGLLIIKARSLTDYFRESLSFSVFLEEDVKEADIRMLKKDIDAKSFVKSAEYVSKEEAALSLKEELGEEFISFLGYNPLSPTIDVKLKAEYTNPDSIVAIEKYLLEFPVVSEVYYQESILHLIYENDKKLALFLAVISSFLFIISLTIINSTIRLSVYSKRFIIRTMQLVGATRSFVRRPFLIKSAFHGLLAAILALTLLMGMLYLVSKEIVMLLTFENINLLLLLMVIIVFTGVVMNVVSTYFAVNRYLSIPEDKLYI